MPKEKDLTIQDVIEGDILKKLNIKKRELESQIKTLENDIDKKKTEIVKMTQQVDKEIADKIDKAAIGAQEKINEANRKLKEAEKKLKTAEQREKDSEAINILIKGLDKKSEAFKAERKELDTLRSTLTEKEHKADLLIEQYKKKIGEIPEEPEKPIEKPKKKKR